MSNIYMYSTGCGKKYPLTDFLAYSRQWLSIFYVIYRFISYWYKYILLWWVAALCRSEIISFAIFVL